MLEFNDRSAEIKQLVADDNLNRAIRRLMDFIRDFADDSQLQTEAILLSANHKKFVREERQNLIDFNTAGQIRSRIINQILEVHQEVCTHFQGGTQTAAAVQEPVRKPEPPPKAPSSPVMGSQAGEKPIKENEPQIREVEAMGFYKDPEVEPPAEARQPDTPQPDLEIIRKEEEPPVIRKDPPAPVLTPRPPEVPKPPVREIVVCSTRNLNKLYRKSNFKLTNIDLEVGKNEILGVVGENGNGKTTLFRILTGELKHDSGDIQFPVFGETDSRKLDWIKIKNNIAYVQQELPRWYGSLLSNLHYEAACNNILGKTNKKEIEFIIHRLGLAEHIDKKWHQLSGGYKLRFSLARAFVKKPRLLVLDEPLANLDINAQTLVLNDLRDLANSIKYPVSIVISSQHLHEVEYIADKILFIRDGVPVFYGHKSELGNDRKYNYFELQTDLNKEELFEKLERIKVVDIIYDSLYAQIVTPLDVSSEQLIQELLNRQVPIRYFRDISKSTKKLFV